MLLAGRGPDSGIKSNKGKSESERQFLDVIETVGKIAEVFVAPGGRHYPVD